MGWFSKPRCKACNEELPATLGFDGNATICNKEPYHNACFIKIFDKIKMADGVVIMPMASLRSLAMDAPKPPQPIRRTH